MDLPGIIFCISGCIFLDNGYAVLCDLNKQALKLLDASLEFNETYHLTAAPWDITPLDENNVLVSLYGKKQIQHIQVLPKFGSSRIIQLDYFCTGIVLFDYELYTAYPGGVRILDLDGNVMKQFLLNDELGRHFARPRHIAVRDTRIYVSSGETGAVACLSNTGNLIYRVIKKQHCKSGLLVDSGNTLYVCDMFLPYKRRLYEPLYDVSIISPDGKKIGPLLTKEDGLICLQAK